MMTNILRIFVFTFSVSLFIACSSDSSDGDSSGSTPPLSSDVKPAFPGAEGGGYDTKGGAGGNVYIVTNLNDNGVGSLRYGLQNERTTIVFAVAGQINLQSKLEITKSYITIAGQTAPGDGITIAGYPVMISSSNVIIRYLRFRMGDQNIDNTNFNADDGDALGGKGGKNGGKNIIIDHCSISWSTDECASFSRVENFTMQYCIISESLRLAGHSKGNHGYGGIWGGRNATYHHNLLAHHDSRNPRFDHEYVGQNFIGPIDFVNNVVYNWGSNSSYGGETASASNVFHINMVGNYYQAGPSTNSNVQNRLMQLTSHCTNCVKTTGEAYPAKIYLTGNLINNNNATWDNIDMDGSSETRDKTALKNNAKLNSSWKTNITLLNYTENANNAYNSVLSYAGASLVRDVVDERIINDVKSGTGKIINTVSDTPGYPTLNAGMPIIDTDKDGMPDDWEIEQMAKLGITGLSVDKFSPSSYNLSSRYTNLEVYMNELVTHTFPSGAGASNTR